jgi:hypothetical protein
LGQKNKIKESTAEKWNGNLRENYIIINMVETMFYVLKTIGKK